MVDPALNLSLAQLGTSALSLLHTEKKNNVFCICFFEGFASYPGYLPLTLLVWDQVLLTFCVCFGVSALNLVSWPSAIPHYGWRRACDWAMAGTSSFTGLVLSRPSFCVGCVVEPKQLSPTDEIFILFYG